MERSVRAGARPRAPAQKLSHRSPPSPVIAAARAGAPLLLLTASLLWARSQPPHARAQTTPHAAGRRDVPVDSVARNVTPGRVGLYRVEEKRTASARDRDLAAADSAFLKAEALRAEGDGGSSREALEKYDI